MSAPPPPPPLPPRTVTSGSAMQQQTSSVNQELQARLIPCEFLDEDSATMYIGQAQTSSDLECALWPRCGKMVPLIALDSHFNSHLVEILPWLFLGNEQNSRNREELDRFGIQRIVNCAAELKNPFKEDLTYFNCDLRDDWEDNLDFSQVIGFISVGKEKGEHVLVHWVQGVSRSVTIILAYLMIEEGMVLQQAYQLVKNQKEFIKPNPNYLWQLIELEEKLYGRKTMEVTDVFCE